MMVSAVISIILVVVLIGVYLSIGKKGEDSSSSLNSAGSEAQPNNMHYSAKGGVNNPGYLIHTITKWQGKSDSEGCKFENFASMPYGVRAWYINLFGKVKDGRIRTIVQMIDVLTPAGSENSEVGRNNYKASVCQATSWLDLGYKVFEFEANPTWKSLNEFQKRDAIEQGILKAAQYCYPGGQLPQLIPAK